MEKVCVVLFVYFYILFVFLKRYLSFITTHHACFLPKIRYHETETFRRPLLLSLKQKSLLEFPSHNVSFLRFYYYKFGFFFSVYTLETGLFAFMLRLEEGLLGHIGCKDDIPSSYLFVEVLRV